MEPEKLPPELEEELTRKQITEMKERVTSIAGDNIVNQSPVKKDELANYLNPEEIGFDPQIFLSDFYNKITNKLAPRISLNTGDLKEMLENTSPDENEILPGEKKYYIDPNLEEAKDIVNKMDYVEIRDFLMFDYVPNSKFPPEALILCKDALPGQVQEVIEKQPGVVGMEIYKSLREQFYRVKTSKELEDYCGRIERIGIDNLGKFAREEMREEIYGSRIYSLLGEELGSFSIDLDKAEKVVTRFSSLGLLDNNNGKEYREDMKEEDTKEKRNYFELSIGVALYHRLLELRDSSNLNELGNFIDNQSKLLNDLENRGYFTKGIEDIKSLQSSNLQMAVYLAFKDLDKIDLASFDDALSSAWKVFENGLAAKMFNSENVHEFMEMLVNNNEDPLKEMDYKEKGIHVFNVVLQNIQDDSTEIPLLKSSLDKITEHWIFWEFNEKDRELELKLKSLEKDLLTRIDESKK